MQAPQLPTTKTFPSPTTGLPYSAFRDEPIFAECIATSYRGVVVHLTARHFSTGYSNTKTKISSVRKLSFYFVLYRNHLHILDLFVKAQVV
jgi:hypothetical protein